MLLKSFFTPALNGVKEEPEEEAKTSSARKRTIPRLDLNSARKDSKLANNSARKNDGDKPEMLKSKTRTIYKNRGDSKIPVSTHSKSEIKEDSKKSPEHETKETTNGKQDIDNKTQEKRDKSAIKQRQVDDKSAKPSRQVLNINEAKENIPEFGVPARITKTRSALDLEHRVRSSGYGAPVNPKLRPTSLKPRSASFISNSKRQSSASSVKSNKTLELRNRKLDALPDLVRETSHPIGKTIGKMKMIPKTIEEETNKTVKNFLSSSIDDKTPKTSTRVTNVKKSSDRSDRTDRTERSELKILREESTASDLLDTSQIQDRLSSIKRKVEARRRGRDSRSSTGSDFDSSFMDR